MKKNVIFILLLTILSSCKSEYEEYSGTDAIYLNEISDTGSFFFMSTVNMKHRHRIFI